MLIRLFAIFIAFTGSCACAQNTWEKDAPINFVPKESTRVRDGSIFVITDEDFDRASNRLSKSSFVRISDEEAANLIHAPVEELKDGTKKYLVRSVYDYRNGKYTAFLEHGKLLVFWGGFGPCGRVVNSALLIKSDDEVLVSYASCTGVD